MAGSRAPVEARQMTKRTHGDRAALVLLALSLVAPAAVAAAEDNPAAGAGEDEQFLSGAAQPTAEPAAEPVAGDEAAAQPAGEAEPAGEGAADPGKWGGKLRDHRHQGFVNVLAATGWYMVAPYDKNDPDKACGWQASNNTNTADGEGEPVCSGRSGFHLDFLGGFGVTDGIEVFAMFRLGVEQPDERLPETRLIGAGIKVYTPSDGLFKIGFGVAPLFDFSERRAADSYDFMIHVPIAAHFDFVPWFGTYLQVAPNISFVTEFKIDITAGLGVQGRFP
jgi:hypothetical protein